MTRRVRFWLAYAYLVAAALTFNFAIPIECDHAVTRSEFFHCVGQNVSDSFWAGIAWPAFLTWEVVR